MISQKQKTDQPVLPLIEEPKSFIIRMATRVVTLTFIGIVILVIVSLIVFFTVDINTSIDSFGVLQYSRSKWGVIIFVHEEKVSQVKTGNSAAIEILESEPALTSQSLNGQILYISQEPVQKKISGKIKKIYEVGIAVNNMGLNVPASVKFPVKVKIVLSPVSISELLSDYIKSLISSI